jgi:diguanylate cyclase (GGDEF)-like protein
MDLPLMTTTLQRPARPADAAILIRALSESRDRWRAMVAIGADLAFETDAKGCFTVLAPETVLGWPVAGLIGTPAKALLVTGPRTSDDTPDKLFDPFDTPVAVRRRRVWLRNADGGSTCMLISSAPVPDQPLVSGQPGAVRGVAIDMTGQERYDSQLATTLLRHETNGMLARHMRHSALPFASLGVALAELLHVVEGRGAILVLHDAGTPLRVAAKAGQTWPAPIQILHDTIQAACEPPLSWRAGQTRQSDTAGQSLLLCAGTNHFIDRAILAIWREGNAWNEREIALVAGLLPTMQPILEHEQIQRESARLSRTDSLTGLFNRQGFIAELPRRLERLDREGLLATLMVVGLDGLGPINVRDGLEAGDKALHDAANVFRDAVRPTDLVARLGGDLFALWLDGADQFAAAERADHLRLAGVLIGELPKERMTQQRMTVSIGLAVRGSRSFESIDSLLHRAWAAMHSVKLAGGGKWRVSAAEPTP